MEPTRPRADTDNDHTLRSRTSGTTGVPHRRGVRNDEGVVAMKFGSMPVRYRPRRGAGQPRGHAGSVLPVAAVTADPGRPSQNAMRVDPGRSRNTEGGTA
jgi:hypothetical protein